MLYDIIRLPNRYDSGDTIDTSVLRFFKPPEEVIDVFGRVIPAGYIGNNLCKYKTIELQNNRTIERVFVTPEEIDLKKKWTTCKTDIFPIWYKIYQFPFAYKSEVNRYVGGITALIDYASEVPCDCGIGTSINNIIADIYKNKGYIVPQYKKEMGSAITSGDDSSNLQALIDADNCPSVDEYHDSSTFIDDIHPCPISPDTDNQIYIPIVPKVKDLRYLISNMFQNGRTQNDVDILEIPFDIRTVEIEEANPDCRSCFHELILYLEQSSFTDLNIVAEHTGTSRVKAYQISSIKGYSRYQGLVQNDYILDRTKDDIENRINMWVDRILSKTIPMKVTITKTWTEEIFIELDYADKTKRQYYIDLVIYGIGSLSVITG